MPKSRPVFDHVFYISKSKKKGLEVINLPILVYTCQSYWNLCVLKINVLYI